MPAAGSPTPEDISSTPPNGTDRDRAEEWRRRSQAMCSSIIAIAADAIVSIDEEQRITLFNHGAEEIFGYSAEEVLGRPLDILIPEGMRDIHRHHIREFAASSIAVRRMGERGEVVGRRKNGDLFPADASISKTEVEGERVYTAVLRDITARVHVEAALREANEDLHALLLAAPLAIVAIDPNGAVEIWNPAAERILGWSEAEMLGRRAPFLPGEEWGECLQQVERARRGEAVSGFRVTCLRRDGVRLSMLASVAPLRDVGELRGVVLILEDESERWQAEESERRLSAILEATPDLVGMIDPEGCFIYLNQAGRKMLGLEGQEISGRTIAEMYPESALPLVLQEAIPTAIREGSWIGEAAILGASGKEIPVSKVIIAHRGPNGEVEYLSTVIHDITERKRAEETRQFIVEAGRTLSSSIEFEEVLRSVVEVVVPWLADFCIIDLVEEGGEVSRPIARHRDLAKQALVEQLRRYPGGADRPLGPARVLKTGEPEVIPAVVKAWLRAYSRNEEHHQLLLQLGPISVLSVPLSVRGQVIGVITGAYAESGRHYSAEILPLAVGLAARAALAIDNARLYRGLKDALRMRDEVLRIVAHDLRNPLNTISLSTGILLESMPPEMADHCGPQLAIIHRAIDRANRLIGDLLDVARVRGGRLSLELRPVETIPLLEEVLAHHQVPAEEEELHLERRFPAQLPAIMADRDRILQVFGNLLSNAIKVTPPGGRITIGAEQQGSEIRCSVSDTGPGIPAEAIPHLFDAFWQARPEAGEGTGLGLTISQGIVTAHGGRIWVESTVGEGTTFYFTLPVAPPTSEQSRNASG